MDPEGVVHTIDPDVAVLRVDKVRRGRRGGRVPIGAWSNFANHGTVVHAELQAYSGDHHASAWRVFADKVRRAGKVPRRQTVVNVYPNADEGDQTAGIVNVGPAAADRVGRVEAARMFKAWKRAGRRLTRRPALEGRWTRACFCDRETATGPVDATGRAGAGFFTGSEEGRGPLYDVTGVPFEGRRCPDQGEPQGPKCVVPAGEFPPAVPIALWRIGDHALVTMPGEATKQVGENARAAVLAAMRDAGVRRVVIAGLALEFVQYVSTPEEYPWQSYEGATTLYGANEGTFLQERYVELAKQLIAGEPAEKPYEYDASYGVKPDGAPFPEGAASGAIAEQPRTVQRLQRAAFSFTGAPSGHDLPADRAFITAQRRVGKRWRPYATDLGMQFLWRGDESGKYTVQWEVPLSAPTGRYRFRVTARRYALRSKPFRVLASTALKRVGGRLAYPEPKVNVDLTWRPRFARRVMRNPEGNLQDGYGNTAG
jgi:neutral ceramidase